MVCNQTVIMAIPHRKPAGHRHYRDNADEVPAVKSYRAPPTTLGSAPKAHLTLIGGARICCHQVEPDPAEMAERHGAETTVLSVLGDAVTDTGKKFWVGDSGSQIGPSR